MAQAYAASQGHSHEIKPELLRYITPNGQVISQADIHALDGD